MEDAIVRRLDQQHPPEERRPHAPTPSVPPLTPEELLTLEIKFNGSNVVKRAVRRARKRLAKTAGY